MTSEGSPYGRFRRALERRQSTAALSAAAELQHVSLTDALELLLLLRDRDPARYPRAVLRWHGRFCREVPGVTPSEAGAVLALLAAIEDDSTAGHAARALAELLDGREIDQAARVLHRWALGSEDHGRESRRSSDESERIRSRGA